MRSPPDFNRVVAPFLYTYPADRMIVALKFNRQLVVARIFATLMVPVIEAASERLPDCLIPMPLHRWRYLKRGFNPSLELARGLAATLGVPCDPRCCRRIRATREQSRLNAADRRRNVRGAFVTTRALNTRSVAIVDDVMTTGSTANELARTLRAAGAESVEVWVVARAIAG